LLFHGNKLGNAPQVMQVKCTKVSLQPLEIFACFGAAAKRMELLNASPKTFPAKSCEGMRHFFLLLFISSSLRVLAGYIFCNKVSRPGSSASHQTFAFLSEGINYNFEPSKSKFAGHVPVASWNIPCSFCGASE
jgi:hypothetical protein